MDIAAILFLIFGWINDVTGLKITALVISSALMILLILQKTYGTLDNAAARIVEHIIIVSLAIISMVI